LDFGASFSTNRLRLAAHVPTRVISAAARWLATAWTALVAEGGCCDIGPKTPPERSEVWSDRHDSVKIDRRTAWGRTALARWTWRAENDIVDVMRGARATGVQVVVLVLVLVTGCSGGDGGSSDTSGPSTAATSSTTASSITTSSLTTVAGSSTTAAIEDPTEAIRAAFETFYDGAGTTVDAKLAVLEDGERYRVMIEDASANPQFQSLTIDIREIRLATDGECAGLGATAPCAVVTHDLLVAGAPMLVAQQSVAVQVDGSWLVAASSWCAVVAIGGETCP